MDKLPKDQGMWNAIFSIAFLVLLVTFFWSLTGGFNRLQWIYSISTFDLVLLSLATFRLVRLISYDKIFAFVRDWFMDEMDGGMVKPKGGIRRTIAELIECIWCTGLWTALFVSILYFSSSLGHFLVVVLAVAAIGSFLQNVSQMVARIGGK